MGKRILLRACEDRRPGLEVGAPVRDVTRGLHLYLRPGGSLRPVTKTARAA